MFYDKLFSSLDFTLPRAATGRRGFPKEAMVCAFIVMKCEGFTQITDLMDYLDNNRLIAHYCGFNIMEPLPSYWTYDRCLRQLNNGALKSIMADLVRQLYELGIVDASFIKEQREATGEDVPAWLGDTVSTYEKVSVGIRKS